MNNTKNKIFRFFYSFFFSFGFSSFILLIVEVLSNMDVLNPRLLFVAAVVNLICTVITPILYGRNRALLVIVYPIMIAVAPFIAGKDPFASVESILKLLFIGIIPAIIFIIVVFNITDKKAKKTINRINEKLDEINKE